MRRTVVALLGVAVAATSGQIPDTLWAVDPHAPVIGQLTKYESLETCVLPAREQREIRVAAFRQAAARNALRTPVRNIRDAYPAFAAIAVGAVVAAARGR